jgi:uncharacterized repeat protein (TIGR03803 family)
MQRAKLLLSALALFAALVAGKSNAATYTVLGNANEPNAGLTLSANGSTLYGTSQENVSGGTGNVFSIPVAGGPVTVLTTFGNGASGAEPSGDLTLSGSTLYGTAPFGGPSSFNVALNPGYGTVFSIPTSGGTPTALASFNGTDGANPFGNLTLVGSTLYGTTSAGGASFNGGDTGFGAIFSVPTSGGTPTVLASFNSSDGANPYGGLTLSANGSTFYGMTQYGGAHNDGTIFSIPVTGGTPTVLFSFDGTHGEYPSGNLTLIGSHLYGMTQYGGADNNGVVFSIPVTGGTPTILAALTTGQNGVIPLPGTNELPGGSLTLVGSTLYGAEGGVGTIFSVPVAGGPLTTVFSISNYAADGTGMTGDMLLHGSTLYGMTTFYGPGGNGTVFALALPEPSSAVLLGCGAIGCAAMAFRRKLQKRAAQGP